MNRFVASWLQKNLIQIIEEQWDQEGGEKKIGQILKQSFLLADKTLLTAKGGFLGFGERGVGGSKCGATAAVGIVFTEKAGGEWGFSQVPPTFLHCGDVNHSFV